MKKLIPAIGLNTVSGKSIKILNYGELNTIGGPDIFNCKIKIGDTIWAGNVEIHVNASDWIKHNHQVDEAYNSVILHVVFNNDKPVYIDKVELETLELPKELCSRYLEKFESAFKSMSSDRLPCSSILEQLPNIIVENWKTRLLTERLESKLNTQTSKTDVVNFVWNIIMGSFGLKYNKNPMNLIAESIDFNGNVLDNILSGVDGAASGLNLSVTNQKVLYSYDVSGFESTSYRRLDSRLFIYDWNTDTTIDISDNKPGGTNDLEPTFSPNEAFAIFTNTSNDGISQKDIYKIKVSNDGEEDTREQLYLNAFMPDWE